jgi:DNA-binding transcriptional LysR family regulator
MLDWNDLRYFLAIQRAGTLVRAGGALGISPTTVGRRLTALEDSVQARLFDRTPEGYALTPAGQELLVRAERMEAEVLTLERDVMGSDRRATGRVRVSTPEMLATRLIAPHLAEFARACPGIALDLVCTNRVVSLARREADVALRLSRPDEENVITRRLTTLPVALYASRTYLAEQGTPSDPERVLTGHRVILFADSRMFEVENAWLLERIGQASIALRSNSVSAIYSATQTGLGIALLPRSVADADPLLVRIPTDNTPEPRVVWQVSHEGLQKSARVRAVLAFLGELFGSDPG